MGMKLIFAFILALSASTSAFALDQTDQDGLKDTQALLGDQKRMEEMGRTDAEMGKALNQLKQISGNDAKVQAEVNAVASSVFSDMAHKNSGDSVSIHDQLQKALADPKAFMNGLSPEQQKKIRDLASEIDKKNAAAAKK
jgi:hypothetical protein